MVLFLSFVNTDITVKRQMFVKRYYYQNFEMLSMYSVCLFFGPDFAIAFEIEVRTNDNLAEVYLSVFLSFGCCHCFSMINI